MLVLQVHEPTISLGHLGHTIFNTNTYKKIKNKIKSKNFISNHKKELEYIDMPMDC